MTKIADPVQLFNCPGPKPNGLQATKDGLWVIDQGNNYAYLLDWKDGNTLKSFETENILFDPHTATSIQGNKDLNLDHSELVTFATAHPAKFPDAINKELDILEENTPSPLKEIMTKEESFSVLENSFEDLNNYINLEILN